MTAPPTDTGDDGRRRDRLAAEHRPVAFQRTRRQFLLSGVTWLRVRAQTTPDRPALKLSALGTAGDERLASITPMMAPGVRFTVRDGLVCGEPGGAEAPVPVLAASGAGLAVFNAMNGTRTLAEVARLVAAQTESSYEDAFLLSRAVFLHLVGLEVCIPKERG